ncbi:MAG: RNA 2',3'-cyclic phosphodiesterase [Anaerolineales bacterium]|nr:RNA 2',3'-cyclic phosphodiesterase [Anaerolineales bacterium]
MEKSIRAFIAIELSAELKLLLGQVARELEQRIPEKTIRWVKPEAMHLTLIFLGDTPISKLDPIKRAIEKATGGISPLALTITGIGCFPNTRRPRNVWVGIQEPAGQLARLKRTLDKTLEPLGYKPENRNFTPHLTLGRVNKRAGRTEAGLLGAVIESATLEEVGRMTVDQIHLIRSDLRPTGPIYTRLASAALLPGPTGNPDHSN